MVLVLEDLVQLQQIGVVEHLQNKHLGGKLRVAELLLYHLYRPLTIGRLFLPSKEYFAKCSTADLLH